MNSLVDKLPTVAVIDGKEYPINTNFRNSLKAVMAFEDPELTIEEKNAIALELIYPTLPNNITEAYEIAMQFLNCGDSFVPGEGEGENGRFYSFQKDAPYIFTAFSQTHGIDLETIDYLHWWKFCYMFMDLREDCFFSHLVDLRIRKKSGKLTKEERSYCDRHRDIIDLPETVSPETEEAKNTFLELLGEKG